MNSYLSTLAARATGKLPSIRPRLASVFEPAVPRGGILQAVAAAQRRDTTNTKQRLHGPHRTGRESRDFETPGEKVDAGIVAAFRENPNPRVTVGLASKPTSTSINSPAIQAADFAAAPAAARPDDIHVAVAGVTRRRENAAHAVHQEEEYRIVRTVERLTEIAKVTELEKSALIQTESRTEPLPTVVIARDKPEPERSATVVVRPDIARRQPEQLAVESPTPRQETPSSIRITIGRVDVRAIMPPSQPVSASPRNAAELSPLSLDEYLRKRSGA